MKRKILVVAAHPDDEVLGCGATIRRHVDEGDEVDVVIMADGESSRTLQNEKDHILKRESCTLDACKILGIDKVDFLRMPDNQMDSLPFLTIVQLLEKIIKKNKPSVIYTHYINDLNIDHQLTAKAVFTICRPYTGQSVKEIYSFEIASSTNWSPNTSMDSFNPSLYIDVSMSYSYKVDALKAYQNEILEFPHSRSIEAIEALTKWRGATVGCSHAEAFMVERLIKSKN